MTALIESLTWWPWNAEAPSIHNVRQEHEAPGLITLRWCTSDRSPTLLTDAAGVHLFRDATERIEHRVTLTGAAGTLESILIRAGEHEHPVEIGF